MIKRISALAASLLFALLVQAQTYINEDFSTFTTGNAPPLSSGWKITDSLNTPPQPDSMWRFDNPGGRLLNAPISGIAAIIDSDFYGNGNSQDAYLLSPNFDASLATAVTLEFDHYHQQLTNVADVEVFDGANWIVVASFGTTTTANPAHEIIDLSPFVAGVANAQIRFHYTGSWAWYWIVDNVNVFQPIPDDLAALSVDSLVQGCGLGSAEPVALRFTNVGSTVVTSVPVQYTLNGGAPVTEIWAGTLNPGDTAIHSFTTRANMAIPGSYVIQANTALRGDANPSNDSTSGNAFHKPIISSYPYFEDFESGTGGWSASGANSSWALGTPANAVINSAGSGSNSWITGLTGPYNSNEESIMEGPCYDFSSLSLPQIKMKVWWNSEFSWDGAALQTSVDNGLSWQNVGAFGDPNNWYNDNSIDGLTNLAPSQEGWTGRTSSNDGSGGWVLAEHDLPGLGGVSGVQVRIVFGSDGSVQDDGFAFDDILIQDAPSADAGIVAIPRPGSGCGLGTADSVELRIINAGGAPIFNFPVNYEVNGGTTVTETYLDTIFPLDTANYVFNTTVNLSTIGNYDIKAYSSLAGDGNFLNDTLNKTITNIPILNTFPYFQDFESGNAGWTSGGNASSWALGTPAGTTIIGASSGSNAWITGLSANYNALEQSFVQGPCFDFSNLIAPQVKLDVWWNSEFSWDGAALQTSVDGGASWQNVGAFGDPNNWYNDNTINGFTGNQDGWTGRNSTSNGSGGWVTAEHDLAGLAGLSGVLIRVAFGADGSGMDDGFAFDNFLIQEAPNDDVGVVSVDAPLSGCNLGSADSVKISIGNFGINPASNFPVGFIFNGGTAVTETFTGTILPGDTAQYTFTSATVNVSAFNTTYIIDAYTALAGDGNVFNDTLDGYSVVNNTQSFPYSENFDALPSGQRDNYSNGWVSYATGGNLPWQSNTGSTSSTATGPTGDNTSGSGIYMYTETSGATGSAQGYLESTCIDLTGNTTNQLRLVYHYHMYGADIGALAVEIDSLGTWVLVDTIIGQQQTANADPFYRQEVDLSAYLALTQSKIRFSHVAYPGGYNGDISIDDVSLDDLPVNIAENKALANDFKIYPNPSNGEFRLSLKAEKAGQMNLKVNDLSGKLIHQESLSVNGTFNKTFDFSGLAKGVYLMRIETGNQIRTEKLVIQ